MKTVALWLSSLLFFLCDGQTCTAPVYTNNFAEANVGGPCPSSQVIAPVGSTIHFKCSYKGGYLTFWNITDIPPIVGTNKPPPNSGIIVTISGSGNGFTTLTLPVTEQDSLGVQCGLCNGVECFQNPLQPTVISLPVEMISFGK